MNAANMYLRDAVRSAASPLAVRCNADGTYTITHKYCPLVWERSDAESTLATYRELRRNYLRMFRDDEPWKCPRCGVEVESPDECDGCRDPQCSAMFWDVA